MTAVVNTPNGTLHIPSLAAVLPCNWRWRRLDEACEAVFDCPHSTPVLTTDGPFVVRTQDVMTGTFRADQAARVSEETYQDRIRRAEPQHGDLLYSREGTYFGVAAEVPADTRVCLGQRMVLLRPKAKDVCPRYLKYWLNSPILASHVHGQRDGTVAERLNMPTIRALPVPVPPFAVQHRVGDILGSLDDKIELNRRMNETLESMARRLFKSWFVDFDPVQTKAAVRRQHPDWPNDRVSREALPTLDPKMAELFPDEFEESAFERHPKGWGSRPLYDIAEFVNGAPFKNSDFCDPTIGHPVVKIAELKSGVSEQTKYSQKDVGAKREIKCGDLLYSWSGSPDTSLDAFRWTGGKGLVNQHIFKVVANDRPDKLFAYCLLKSLRPVLIEIARNKQTTGLGHVTVADMQQLNVASPPSAILLQFEKVIGAIYDLSFDLEVESKTLAKIRDMLIARLLSGDLTVSEEAA